MVSIVLPNTIKQDLNLDTNPTKLVGVRGLEPPTPASQTQYSSHLSYTPIIPRAAFRRAELSLFYTILSRLSVKISPSEAQLRHGGCSLVGLKRRSVAAEIAGSNPVFHPRVKLGSPEDDEESRLTRPS